MDTFTNEYKNNLKVKIIPILTQIKKLYTRSLGNFYKEWKRMVGQSIAIVPAKAVFLQIPGTLLRNVCNS